MNVLDSYRSHWTLRDRGKAEVVVWIQTCVVLRAEGILCVKVHMALEQEED